MKHKRNKMWGEMLTSLQGKKKDPTEKETHLVSVDIADYEKETPLEKNEEHRLSIHTEEHENDIPTEEAGHHLFFDISDYEKKTTTAYEEHLLSISVENYEKAFSLNENHELFISVPNFEKDAPKVAGIEI